MNGDGSAALAYHAATNHTPESVRRGARHLDWANEPRPFKLYPTLAPLELPAPAPLTASSALRAISGNSHPDQKKRTPSVAELAALLHYSAGVTHWLTVGTGKRAFRAAACTGALYHIDLYLVCGDLPGLPAGVYHYGPQDNSLRNLRQGDWRGLLLKATGAHPCVAEAPANLLLTTTYWRNAWKYQNRAYRHAFWDSGTILANALSVAAAIGLPAGVLIGFVDHTVNQLLDLDEDREVVLEIVPVGRGADEAREPSMPMRRLAVRSSPYSLSEEDNPAIRAVHRASSLATGGEVARWREMGSRIYPVAGVVGEALPPPLSTFADADDEPLDGVIRRRGSPRRFAGTPIRPDAFSTLLAVCGSSIPFDFTTAGQPPLTETYCVVNAVTGMQPGIYRYDRGSHTVKPIARQDMRPFSKHAALDQALGGDAAVNFYLMADLESILGALGDRGYRAAQLDGAIRAGRMYLAAYALRLGATGLTFYDDVVSVALMSGQERSQPMFLLAVGERAKG